MLVVHLRMLTRLRYVVEAIKKHIIDDDVSRILASLSAGTADGDDREP